MSSRLTICFFIRNEKLLICNITAKYQQVGSDVTQSINPEAKGIAQSLKLDDRLKRFSKRKTFVTLKNHKLNFPNNLKCRQINLPYAQSWTALFQAFSSHQQPSAFLTKDIPQLDKPFGHTGKTLRAFTVAETF